MIEASVLLRGRAGHHTAHRVARLAIALAFGVVLAATIDVGRLAVGSVPGGAMALTLAGLSAAAAIGYAAARTRTPAQRRPRLDAEAAALAHDMRSPLLAARAYLDMMEEGAFGPLSADGADAAARAGHATSRAQAMLDGWLFRFASETRGVSPGAAGERTKTTGGLGQRGEPVADVQALARDVIDSMALEMAQAHAQVEIGALPRVRADEDAVYRVLLNLAQNALRHRDPAVPLQLSISAEARGELWELAVSDNGPGITSGLRERLFEPGV